MSDRFLNVSATIGLQRCLGYKYPYTPPLHGSCALHPESFHSSHLFLLASRLTAMAKVTAITKASSISHPTMGVKVLKLYRCSLVSFSLDA
jgi:hypothetical protein